MPHGLLLSSSAGTVEQAAEHSPTGVAGGCAAAAASVGSGRQPSSTLLCGPATGIYLVVAALDLVAADLVADKHTRIAAMRSGCAPCARATAVAAWRACGGLHFLHRWLLPMLPGGVAAAGCFAVAEAHSAAAVKLSLGYCMAAPAPPVPLWWLLLQAFSPSSWSPPH